MIGANSYDEICNVLTYDFQDQNPQGASVRLTGLLFARPSSPLAQKEIVPNLDYFHKRSGKNVHFFCGGYGAYWPPGWISDEISVGHVGNTPWKFSNDLFIKCVKEIEEKTSWRYGDGVELVLVNAKFDSSDQKAYLDFSSALALSLDEMAAKHIITSVETLFGQIFRFAETQSGDDPTWGFGNEISKRSFANALKRFFLSFLPKNIGNDVDELSTYWIRDISIST